MGDDLWLGLNFEFHRTRGSFISCLFEALAPLSATAALTRCHHASSPCLYHAFFDCRCCLIIRVIYFVICGSPAAALVTVFPFLHISPKSHGLARTPHGISSLPCVSFRFVSSAAVAYRSHSLFFSSRTAQLSGMPRFFTAPAAAADIDPVS